MMNETPTTGRCQRRVIRATVVSVLAMAALLLGLFAVHSAGAGAGAAHEMDVAVPVAAVAHGVTSVSAVSAASVVSAASAASVVSVASSADGGWLSFGNDFMAGCGILALTCSVLLTVVALIHLARQPAVYGRLLDAGGFVVGSFRTSPLRVHRPSLTLLSISRI